MYFVCLLCGLLSKLVQSLCISHRCLLWEFCLLLWVIQILNHRTRACSVMSDSCNPVDHSPPSSSVHWIFQARILEWVAISSPGGSSQPKYWTCVSCSSPELAGGFLTTSCLYSPMVLTDTDPCYSLIRLCQWPLAHRVSLRSWFL